MDAPFAVGAGLLLIVALDLAALRFGYDSRNGVREMPGQGDGGSASAPRIRVSRGLWAQPALWALRSARVTGAEWAVAPPLHGLLRLRSPGSATGFARLDLSALGK